MKKFYRAEKKIKILWKKIFHENGFWCYELTKVWGESGFREKNESSGTNIKKKVKKTKTGSIWFFNLIIFAKKKSIFTSNFIYNKFLILQAKMSFYSWVINVFPLNLNNQN